MWTKACCAILYSTPLGASLQQLLIFHLRRSACQCLLLSKFLHLGFFLRRADWHSSKEGLEFRDNRCYACCLIGSVIGVWTYPDKIFCQQCLHISLGHQTISQQSSLKFVLEIPSMLIIEMTFDLKPVVCAQQLFSQAAIGSIAQLRQHSQTLKCNRKNFPLTMYNKKHWNDRFCCVFQSRVQLSNINKRVFDVDRR